MGREIRNIPYRYHVRMRLIGNIWHIQWLILGGLFLTARKSATGNRVK